MYFFWLLKFSLHKQRAFQISSELCGFTFRISEFDPPQQMGLVPFDVGSNYGLGGFIGG